MGNENNEPEGRPMTTAQIRSMPEWPKLEQSIIEAMEKTRIEVGASKVELIDDTYRWLIRVDGEDVMEIDPRDLSEFPKN